MLYSCLHGSGQGWLRPVLGFGTGLGVVLGLDNHKINPSPNTKTNLKLALTPILNLSTKESCFLTILWLDFGLCNPDPDLNPKTKHKTNPKPNPKTGFGHPLDPLGHTHGDVSKVF